MLLAVVPQTFLGVVDVGCGAANCVCCYRCGYSFVVYCMVLVLFCAVAAACS